MKSEYYRDKRVAERYDEDIRPSRDVVTDDIPFYVSLARQSAAKNLSVLELGCGTGRVTIPIAQAGVDVTGLDSSPAMLDVARAKSAGIENVTWVEGDMADFQLDRRYGLVVIPFRSFLLLLTVAEQKACLALIREHLVEGGLLAFNIFNPDLVQISSWLGDRRDHWRRSEEGAHRERWLTRRYETAGQQLQERQLDIELSDEGAIIARVEKTLRLRYVFRYEMEHLLTLAGFTVEALYGWFDGRPYDETSSEMIWLARQGC